MAVTVAPARLRKGDSSRSYAERDNSRQSGGERSSHEKLVNRPRWQFRRDSQEEHDEDQDQDDQDDQDEVKAKPAKSQQREDRGKAATFNRKRRYRKGGKSNTGGDAKPAKAHRPSWSHNRPRWDTTSSESSQLEEGQENSTDDASKDTDHTVLDSLDTEDDKRGSKEAQGLEKVGEKDEEEGEEGKKKKKKGDNKRTSVVSKKRGLQKIEVRRKTKSKGCPGCSKLGASITEARELHKQVRTVPPSHTPQHPLISLSLPLCPCLSVCLSPPPPLSLCLSSCLSVSLSLSQSLSLSLSVPVCLVSVFLSVCVCQSVSLSLSPPLSLSLSVFLSVCLPLSLPLSPPPLSVSLSL